MKRRLAAAAAAALLTALVIALLPVRAKAIRTAVRVGFCPYIAPYQYLDGNGKPCGLHLELMNAVAENCDLVPEYVTFPNTGDAIEALRKGEIDIALGVPKNQYLNNEIRLTDVVAVGDLCLVASEEMAERYRSFSEIGRIAVEYRLVGYNYLLAQSSSVLFRATQEDSIHSLLRGDVGLVVAVKGCVLHYLNQYGTADNYEIVNNHVAAIEYTAAVRSSDWYLCENINNSLTRIRASGLYGRMYDQWIRTGDEAGFADVLRRVAPFAAAVLLIFIIYFTFSYYTKKRLTEQVQARTAELYEANEELKRRTVHAEAESRLRNLIIESTYAGIVMTDAKGNVQYMNHVAMHMAGIGAYQPGDTVSADSPVGKAISSAGEGEPSSNWTDRKVSFEIAEPNSPDARKYRCGIHKSVLDSGEPGILFSIEDVTVEERERAAFFEKEKNKTLNNLIAGIAHEIKNPLTTIRASAEMIESKGNSEKFRQAFSRYIPQEIGRITRLIDNLLDYARPAKSRIERVELTDVLRSVYELSTVGAKGTEVRLELNGNDSLPFVGDSDKIRQALINIVLNGLEATRYKPGDGHSVVISVGEREGQIRISVRDDGVGMTEEELARCTDPFYTTKPAGTGIGLAITRQYIEEIGGSIHLESEKGEYTQVDILLPKDNQCTEVKE